jgi:hypothetical protein
MKRAPPPHTLSCFSPAAANLLQTLLQQICCFLNSPLQKFFQPPNFLFPFSAAAANLLLQQICCCSKSAAAANLLQASLPST